MIPKFPLRVLAVALLAWGISGCAAKVQKGVYQTGLETLARSAQTGSYDELETALQSIDGELERNPGDAQLALLKASLLLRQIRLRADQADVWRLKSPATIEALQRTLQLADGATGLPDWVAPRAWIVAGDLLLTRAEASAAGPETLALQLWRIGLADAAGHFHGRAHQMLEALGRNPSGVSLGLRREAFQGWYAARLRVIRGWLDLGLRPWEAPSLDELWNAWAAGDGIPKEYPIQSGVASFDPRSHRQSAQHAALAHRLATSQRTALARAFEAFRGETLAGFFENPGEVEPPPPRFVNELGAELAASIWVWRIDSEVAPSPSGVRLHFSRPDGLWSMFAPPVRELTVRLGKAVERLDVPSALGTGEPELLRASPEGLWLELGPGVSGCLEPGPSGTCRRASRALGSPDVLAALAGPAVLEIEDGFGVRRTAPVPGPAGSPSRAEIEDRLEDFQTHIRRRGFDTSEARRMLWEVAELCSQSSGLNRHRCRLSVARGFAQLAPADRRLAQPVRQMLGDIHALALSLEDPAQRAEALLAEVEFDLDFGLAGNPDLPASTESKIQLIRQSLALLPRGTADAFTYRLNALEAELR